MRLTPTSAELLRDGARRIYGFGGPVSWDGRWLLLVLRVPEQRRELRHRLTTQLAWAGFGSLGGGLWITPHVDREALVHGRGAGAAAVVPGGARRAGRAPQQVIEEAWDLPDLREHYEQFIEDFAHAAPARRRRRRSPPRPRSCTPGGASRSSIPDLPDDLLPRDWPRRARVRAVPRPPRALGAGRAGSTSTPWRRRERARKRIYVAYVGGTIGMKPTDSGYAPVPGHLTAQIRDRPELNAAEVPELVDRRARAAAGLRQRPPRATGCGSRATSPSTATATTGSSSCTARTRWPTPPRRSPSCCAGSASRSWSPASQIPLGVLRSRRPPEPADQRAGRRARRRARGLPRVRLAASCAAAARSRPARPASRPSPPRTLAPLGTAGVQIEVDESRLRGPSAARSACRWRSTPRSRCCACTRACPRRCCARRWPSRSGASCIEAYGAGTFADGDP